MVKRILALLLVAVMLLGLLAGCKEKTPETPTVEDPTQSQTPSTEPTQPAEPQGPTAEEAMAYLCAIYKNTEEPTPTPVNYDRYGIVRIAGIPFTVVWTVDVSEDLVKVVVNEDGSVTIDVNETCEVATPYTLTATITDEQGGSASHSWDMLLPAAADMTEIVKTAYALAAGESLPYESTLRGEIIAINTVYSAEYKNITVTIAVEGVEDMPIECYRLKGEGADKLAVGNIITVTGTLKNYNGKIEFDAGCTLDAVEEGNAVDTPDDIGAILKAAYALATGEALPYPVTMTGTVTAIDSPYDPAYGNISVIIVADGYSQYPMLAYRMKGVDISKIAINDKITITGIVKNYNGKIEFDAGCQMIDRVSGGGVAQGPSSDANKILSDAANLQPGQKLPYKATLTGEIVSVDQAYDPGYGNVTVTIKVNGTKIQCYRLKGDGADQIRVTDKITVSGMIENYNGKLEFGSGCTLDSWTMGSRVTPVDLGPLKAETAYILQMKQVTLGKVLFFNGQKDGNYLATSENVNDAVKVYVERTEGKGVRFYFMDGETKTYIELESYTNKDGNLRARPALVTSPSIYWTYETSCKVYTVELSGTKYFLGTYGDYNTISSSSTYYITDGNAANVGVSQFIAEFVLPSEAGGDVGGDTPDIPTSAFGTYTTDPQVGVAYKLGLDQTAKNETYYFTGVMSGHYGATETDFATAVDVYLETAEGGYYLYFMDANGAKQYIYIVASGTHINFTFSASDKSVFTFDTELSSLYTTVNGAVYYMGTYSNYVTVGTTAADKVATSYVTHLYTAAAGETPDEPEQPEEPEEPETPVVNSADFNTIVGKTNGGDSSYTGTYTTTNGWVTANSAIQMGGPNVANPAFPVIGPDNTFKAICLNGKVSAPGSITSPTLTGGISKLTINYTKMFTDTKLSATITVTDLATGTTYTHTVSKEADKNDKYTVWTDEWVLETPIAGDFTIAIVNDCPSNSTKNQDRMTVLDLSWESAAPAAPAGGQLMTSAPVTGDVVAIVNGTNVMTATPNSTGKKLMGETATITDGVLTLTETLAQLIVVVDADGYYTFVTAEGKYLTSGTTGNELTLASAPSAFSLWEVVAASEDAWYIKSVNAKYNNSVQSIEFYIDNFTTYGHKDGNAAYMLQLYKLGTAEAPEAPEEDLDSYTEMTIAEARAAESGAKVQITGVVARLTYANGMVPSGVILVDETASIYVYDGILAAQCAIGNTVTVAASKTYWILETEQTNANKYGYLGCNQLEGAKIVEIKNTESEFAKDWIEETTVKAIMDTPVTEDITTKIFKVTAQVKEVPGNGFTNFYINDLDGKTGTYSYSQCNGNDFAWLREFDGKICTVYVMALNAKSSASGCVWRFLPILVEDNGFDPASVNFAENAVKYYGVTQLLTNYGGDPAAELVTTADNALLGYTGATLSFTSSDPSVISIDENVLHCHKTGTVTVTVTGTYGEQTYSEDVVIEVKIVDVNAEYPTVADAIAADLDAVVTVKGIVGPSLVNKDGFYLIDETGIIAVLTSTDTLATLEPGYEVILEGVRAFHSKSGGNWGNTCIQDAKIVHNFYGNNEYSTASFDGTLTLAEFAALDVNTDYTTSVFTVTATVELVETAFYTNLKLVDGETSINLYCSGAPQYSWLFQYAGQEITMELAPCNWSSKGVYPACVLSVINADGTKTINTLNFDKN